MTRISRSTSSRQGRRAPSGPARAKGRPGTLDESILGGLEGELRARVAQRDRWGERARELRRSSQDFMRRLHAGGSDLSASPARRARARKEREEERERLTRMARALCAELAQGGWREEGVVEDALQEWVEANLLWAVTEGRPFPAPEELGVRAEAYLLGLADVVGEVRRLAVAALGRGDVAAATGDLEVMDGLFGTLMHFDPPRSVLAIKPKQDVARSLVERTRGDVELARFMERQMGRKRSKGRRV